MNGRRRLAAACLAALAGALVSVVTLAGVYGRSPALRLEMDRDQGREVSGFYPSERERDLTFAWMGESARLRFPGLDRRVPWSCSAGIMGGRPAGIALPVLRFAADGILARSFQVRKIPEVIDFEIPATPGRPGLVLDITASSTFRPGPNDQRDLGIAFDRLVCEPAGGRRALIPAGSMIRAAAGPAVLGVAFGLAGLPAIAATCLVALAALAQAWPLAAGIVPYYPAAIPVVPLAGGLALTVILALGLADVLRRTPVPVAWRVAAAVSAVACYLKLLVLLHPSMAVMDALFQAHRLEWVLAGNYYFTSLTPDGYHFPYAISLYLAAAPFARFTRDHVALLRIVVVAAECGAGILVFAMAMRAWDKRRAALLALVLFHVTPIAQAVTGTGNLTNAFGESMAVAAVATLVLLPLAVPRWLWLWLPALLAAIAFVAHFSTLVVLAATMVATWLVWSRFGEPPVRRVAARVLAALGMALALAFVTYYGHFWDTYRSQGQRLTSEVQTILKVGPPKAPGDAAISSVASRAPRPRSSAGERFLTMLRRTRGAFGPVLDILALGGVVVLARQKRRDRLTLVVWAWLLTLAAFSVLAVLTPLEMRYHLAVAPAVAMLAAAALSWLMQSPGGRLIAGVVAASAIALGARGWYGWLF